MMKGNVCTLRTHLPASFHIVSHGKNIPELSLCISLTNTILSFQRCHYQKETTQKLKEYVYRYITIYHIPSSPTL